MPAATAPTTVDAIDILGCIELVLLVQRALDAERVIHQARTTDLDYASDPHGYAGREQNSRQVGFIAEGDRTRALDEVSSVLARRLTDMVRAEGAAR